MSVEEAPREVFFAFTLPFFAAWLPLPTDQSAFAFKVCFLVAIVPTFLVTFDSIPLPRRGIYYGPTVRLFAIELLAIGEPRLVVVEKTAEEVVVMLDRFP